MKKMVLLIAFTVLGLCFLKAQSLKAPIESWQFHFEDVVEESRHTFKTVSNNADNFRVYTLEKHYQEIKVNGEPEYNTETDSTRTDRYRIKIGHLPESVGKIRGFNYRVVEYDLIVIAKSGRWKYVATNFEYKGYMSNLSMNPNFSKIKPQDTDAKTVNDIRRLCYHHANFVLGELVVKMNYQKAGKTHSDF